MTKWNNIIRAGGQPDWWVEAMYLFQSAVSPLSLKEIRRRIDKAEKLIEDNK